MPIKWFIKNLFCQKKPEYQQLPHITSKCCMLIRTIIGGISEMCKDSEVNVVQDHFQEVLVLGILGCQLGILKTFQNKDFVRTIWRSLTCEAVNQLTNGEKQGKELTDWIEWRLTQYHQLFQVHGDELSVGDWEGTIKDVGMFFEQACRGPNANHEPNPKDAPLVLYLRHIGYEIFRIAFQMTKEELSKGVVE